MQINLTIGWLLILLGFLSGAVLGLRFHDESWLGGYASFRRRLIRLGHIALVALGAINILFALSADAIAWEWGWLDVASSLLIFGGFAMPLCCALTAWNARAKSLFVLPVTALIAAAVITFIGVIAS